MKRIILASLIFVVLMVFAQVSVLACSCVSLGESLEEEVKRRLKESQTVFSGEVIGINKIPKSLDILIKIKVQESWKGVSSEEMTITTDLSSCGYRFEVGTSYLVFANGSDKGVLTTGECSFNRKLYKAIEELKILGKGNAPQTEISSVIQKDLKPLITETFLIKHLSLCGECTNGDLGVLLSPIQRSLSRRGGVEVDIRAKSITIIDEGENIEAVRKIIERLDKPKNE